MRTRREIVGSTCAGRFRALPRALLVVSQRRVPFEGDLELVPVLRDLCVWAAGERVGTASWRIPVHHANVATVVGGVPVHDAFPFARRPDWPVVKEILQLTPAQTFQLSRIE